MLEEPNTTREPPERGTVVSAKLNTVDADVVFRSEDGILFRLHRKNLEHTCGGFAPQGIPTLDEVVDLTETAGTLEHLFVFVYPQKYPPLIGLGFSEIANLAEAAEKYEVFSAMIICYNRLSLELKEHPIEVMNYGAHHGYPELVDESAPLTLALSLDNVSAVMDLNLLQPWLKYYYSWMSLVPGKNPSSIYLSTYGKHWIE